MEKNKKLTFIGIKIFLFFLLFFQLNLHAQKISKCTVYSKKGELCICSLSELHPTQIAVGFDLVKNKVKHIEELLKEDKLMNYLLNKPEPMVIGPDGVFYIIDHHHLGLALIKANVKTTYCLIQENFSSLNQKEFWNQMIKRKWVYLYDENGRGPLSPQILPKSLLELKDDPYRTLAAYALDEGCYNKVEVPFLEFYWGNYFRKYIEKEILKEDMKKALKKAKKLCCLDEARSLPGFKGKEACKILLKK
jgi:hypothetical protein